MVVADDETEQRRLNMRTTTMAWLARQTPADAYDRLVDIARHNLDALDGQIAFVAALPREERMFRMLSGFLPGWSYPAARHYWHDPDLRTLVETRLARAGGAARAGDVRLSMHPGQHAVLATERPEALANAVVDVVDHVAVFEMMGYGSGWHPHGAHINVHGGAAAPGVQGIRAGLAALPEAARDLITIENDEYSFGLDDLLQVADEAAIVVDFHHHWIHSAGDYLQPEDPRIARLQDSWRGVRPAAHISVSPEEAEPHASAAPDYRALIAAGFGKHRLRAHSDMMWNTSVNDLMAAHLGWCDIEVEAKGKNRASRQLADHIRALAP